MRVYRYTTQASSRMKSSVVDEPEQDTPQKRRMDALAEAQPGRIVVGVTAQGLGKVYEHEDYLEELGAKAP